MNTQPTPNATAATELKGGSAACPTRATPKRAWTALRRRFRNVNSGDAGMSTVEYAVGTIAAAAFGAVLYTVVSGDSIPDALGGIDRKSTRLNSSH